jgi:excisionase family DNA binding protein
MAESDAKLAVDVVEAGRRLSMSRGAIYTELGAGRLKSYRVGRSRRIAVADLNAYLEQRRAEAQPA